MEDGEIVYIHSKCCNGHWAVVCNEEGNFLKCPNCGKSAGLEVLGGPDPLNGENVCNVQNTEL